MFCVRASTASAARHWRHGRLGNGTHVGGLAGLPEEGDRHGPRTAALQRTHSTHGVTEGSAEMSKHSAAPAYRWQEAEREGEIGVECHVLLHTRRELQRRVNTQRHPMISEGNQREDSKLQRSSGAPAAVGSVGGSASNAAKRLQHRQARRGLVHTKLARGSRIELPGQTGVSQHTTRKTSSAEQVPECAEGEVAARGARCHRGEQTAHGLRCKTMSA